MGSNEDEGQITAMTGQFRFASMRIETKQRVDPLNREKQSSRLPNCQIQGLSKTADRIDYESPMHVFIPPVRSAKSHQEKPRILPNELSTFRTLILACKLLTRGGV
jgi:hypothetical protein